MPENKDYIQIERTEWALLQQRVGALRFADQQMVALDKVRLSFVRGTELRPQVYEVRLKPSRDGGGSFLAVVKGFDGSEYTVAYNAGLGLFPTLVELGRRLANGSMKFGPDKWPPEKPPQLYRAD